MSPIVISPRLESWEICVITQGEIGFANLAGAHQVGYQPPGLLYSAGDLLTHVSDSFRDRAEGVLLVDRIPGWMQDNDPTVARWTSMEADALNKGWAPTRSDSEEIRYTGWVSFRNIAHGRMIHLGVLPMLDPKRGHAFDPHGDAATICQQMIDYGSVTGVLWQLTGGVSCSIGIRADRAERAGVQLTIGLGDDDDGQPWWRWDSAPRHLHGAGRPTWTRDLCPAELQGHVVTLDTRAEGLASIASGRYGWGRPTRGRNNPPFDPARAGFWQIPGRALLSLDGPELIDPRYIDTKTGLTWVTTAAMVFYAEQGIEPLVYDSYTSATSSEILKPYALKLRNALYSESMKQILPGIRATYSEGPSMWVKPGGSIYRPDWYHTHQDLGRMNLLRKVYKAKTIYGCWPCRIYGDEVSYPVRDQQEFQVLASALGVKLRKPGEQEIVTSIGKLKLKSRESASEWQGRQDKARERVSAR